MTRPRALMVAILAAAAALRIGLLAAVPRVGPLMSVGIPHQGPAAPAGLIAYLDRRSDHIWFTEDEHSYDAMAQAALRGEGFATPGGWMVAPPGKPSSYGGFTYPALLTVVYFLTGGAHQLPVFLFQVLIALASIPIVYRLGRRAFGDAAGLVATALYGLSPPVVWSSLALMTEAVFVPLVVVALWQVQVAWDSGRARDWAWAGAVLALAALARSTVLYFLPLLVVGLLLAAGPRRAIAAAAPLVGGFLLCVAPWTARNWVVLDRFLLLDTKAGTNLWQYNNPNMVPELGIRAAAGEPPVPVLPEETLKNGGNEVDQDRRYARMFLDYAWAQPGHFLALVACRAILAVSPLPLTNPTRLNVTVGLLFKGPILALAIAGWWMLRRRWRELWPLLSLPLYWWALQALSGPGQRYRIPVDFAYAILAAGGAVALALRLKGRRPA